MAGGNLLFSKALGTVSAAYLRRAGDLDQAAEERLADSLTKASFRGEPGDAAASAADAPRFKVDREDYLRPPCCTDQAVDGVILSLPDFM